MTGGLKPIGTRGPTGADGAAGPAPSGNAGDVVTLASSGVAQSSSPSATRTLLGLGAAALLAVGAGGVAAYTDAPASILTANGDVMVRAAGVPAPLAIGASATVLRSTGSAPAWVTGTTVIDDVASTRGYLLRRGASTWAGFAASTADTFVGGDGTDVTVRTAAQVRASILAPPLAYMGPFTSSAYLGGDTGAVAPSGAKGTALVFQFWKLGPLAGVDGVLAAHLDAGVTVGWDLGYSSGGNLFVFLKGISSDATIGLVGWNSLANGLHGLAINFVDDGGATGHLEWALDGVLQSNVTANGTYVPPTTSTPLIFGRHPAGTVPALLADLAAVRAYSTALSAGDLLTASTPSLSIPAVTGTVSFDLDCARDFWPGYATCVTGAATAQWTLTVNGGLTRRIHR